MAGLETTYGSILFGSAVAFMYVSLPISFHLSPMYLNRCMDSLSGIVGIQCLIYFKLYSNDVVGTKVMVRFLRVVEMGPLTDHTSRRLKVGAVWYV